MIKKMSKYDKVVSVKGFTEERIKIKSPEKNFFEKMALAQSRGWSFQ